MQKYKADCAYGKDEHVYNSIPLQKRKKHFLDRHEFNSIYFPVCTIVYNRANK